MILISLVLTVQSSLWAHLEYDVLDMRHGLPESRVRALCQMPDGRMVVATAGTVSIFDGTRFTVYELSSKDEFPLPDYHGYRHLTCDSTGLVWLRNDGCLYVVDIQGGRVVSAVDSLLAVRHLSPRQVSAWPVDDGWRETEEYAVFSGVLNDEISALVRDSYGAVWIGTRESGLIYSHPVRKRQFRCSDGVFEYKRLPVFRSSRASQFSAKFAPAATNCSLDSRDLPYIYLGTRKGVMIIDRHERLVATLDEHDGLGANNVAALMNDHHGDIWAVTANGLTRLHQDGVDSFSITNYGLLDGIDTQGREFRTGAIYRAPSGDMTVGYAGGICTFHPDSVISAGYVYHFPRPYEVKDQMPQKSSNVSWWIVIPIIVLASIALLLFVRRKAVRRQAANAGAHEGNAMAEVLTADVVKHAVEKRLTSSDEAFLGQLNTIIEEHIDEEDFSVQRLSEMMAMDRTVLYRRMQSLTGISPSVYIRNIRLGIAKKLLCQSDLPISEIAFKTGFSTARYFSTSFKDAFGIKPNEYRTQAKSSTEDR